MKSRLSHYKEDQVEHVKTSLCFECLKPGHRSFECPTIKRKVVALYVEQDDDDGSYDEPIKK